MVIYIANKTISEVIVYNIEFSDLSHIRTLSEDCFNIINDYCGTSYYGDLSKLDNNGIFWFACKNNLHTIINETFKKESIQNILKSSPEKQKQWFGIYNMIKYNHINLLKWTTEKFPKSVTNALFYKADVGYCNHSYGYSCGLWEAIQQGHYEIVVWLRETFPKLFEKMFKLGDYFVFAIACQLGHVKILDWIKKEFPLLIEDVFVNHRSFNCDTYKGVKFACRYNQINVLIWLKDNFSKELMEQGIDGEEGGYEQACEEGSIKVLDWLKNNFPKCMECATDDKYYFEYHWTKGSYEKVRNWLVINYPVVIEYGTFDNVYIKPNADSWIDLSDW